MKKIEKKIKIIFCSIIIFIISVIGILTTTNDNIYNATEGRILERFPKPEIQDFLHDEIYNKYTNAFSDQMIVKNIFIRGYYYLNQQKYISDVIKGKNDYLFLEPKINENDAEYISDLKKIIERNMNEVADNVNKLGAEFIFLSIPRKDVVLNKYLPDYYIDGTQDYLKYINIIKNTKNNNVNLIDTYNLLKDKNVFYQNDHHLNINGAYILFEEIIKKINKKNNIKLSALQEEYKIEKRIVEGSFDRKIGYTHKKIEEDLILTPLNEKITYTRFENGKKSNVEIFGKGSTYASAYMGNDCAETIIDTNQDDKPNILYVGTSFTNILEALSVYKFNKVVSVDYRHNNSGKTISEYVKENDIDYVIFICSQSDDALNIDSIKQQLGY